MLHRRLARLLPSQCELCRGWDDGLVCQRCRTWHAPARPRCARCGLVLGIAAPSCGACRAEPPPYARTVVALDYGFPWDRLIVDFKFHRRIELATPLASLLTEAIDRESGDAAPLLVTAVPLAPARLAERGFNQAWELARRIAPMRGRSSPGTPPRPRALPGLLQRVLETPHQAELSSAERRRNLRNAFAPGADADRWVAGQCVALVDDVMTTGATAQEAAAALLRAGASAVHLWVLARTPEQSD